MKFRARVWKFGDNINTFTGREWGEGREEPDAFAGVHDLLFGGEQADPAAAQKALEELKATFSDLGAAEKDFETALPKILAAYSARGAKIAELETRVKGLASEVSSAQTAASPPRL